MRYTACKFDNINTAHNITPAIGDNLTVFRREQSRQFIHMGVDELLIGKHNAGTFLRVGLNPFNLRLCGRSNGGVKFGGRGHIDLRLNRARIGIKYILGAARRSRNVFTIDEMTNLSHNNFLYLGAL